MVSWRPHRRGIWLGRVDLARVDETSFGPSALPKWETNNTHTLKGQKGSDTSSLFFPHKKSSKSIAPVL
jgi:hypothetical protein